MNQRGVDIRFERGNCALHVLGGGDFRAAENSHTLIVYGKSKRFPITGVVECVGAGGIQQISARCSLDTVVISTVLESKATELDDIQVSIRIFGIGVTMPQEEVIAGGISIIYEILKTANVNELVISESDNLEGYLSYKGV